MAQSIHDPSLSLAGQTCCRVKHSGRVELWQNRSELLEPGCLEGRNVQSITGSYQKKQMVVGAAVRAAEQVTEPGESCLTVGQPAVHTQPF